MQVNLSRSKWKKFLLFPIFLFEWLISKNSSIVRSIVQPSFIITRSSMEFLTFSPSIPQRHERNKSGFNRCIENAFFTMPRQSFDFFRTRYYIYIYFIFACSTFNFKIFFNLVRGNGRVSEGKNGLIMRCGNDNTYIRYRMD